MIFAHRQLNTGSYMQATLDEEGNLLVTTYREGDEPIVNCFSREWLEGAVALLDQLEECFN